MVELIDLVTLIKEMKTLVILVGVGVMFALVILKAMNEGGGCDDVINGADEYDAGINDVLMNVMVELL